MPLLAFKMRPFLNISAPVRASSSDAPCTHRSLGDRCSSPPAWPGTEHRKSRPIALTRAGPQFTQFVPPPDPHFQSALPEPALAGSLQRGRRSLPSSPQGAVTVALVVCPGVLNAPSGLRASRNSMPNCKVCRHPGHKHYERVARGACSMPECP